MTGIRIHTESISDNVDESLLPGHMCLSVCLSPRDHYLSRHWSVTGNMASLSFGPAPPPLPAPGTCPIEMPSS